MSRRPAQGRATGRNGIAVRVPPRARQGSSRGQRTRSRGQSRSSRRPGSCAQAQPRRARAWSRDFLVPASDYGIVPDRYGEAAQAKGPTRNDRRFVSADPRQSRPAPPASGLGDRPGAVQHRRARHREFSRRGQGRHRQRQDRADPGSSPRMMAGMAFMDCPASGRSLAPAGRCTHPGLSSTRAAGGSRCQAVHGS